MYTFSFLGYVIAEYPLNISFVTLGTLQGGEDGTMKSASQIIAGRERAMEAAGDGEVAVSKGRSIQEEEYALRSRIKALEKTAGDAEFLGD